MRDLVAELAGMAGDLNQMMQAMLAEQQIRLTAARHSLQMASPVMRLQREQQTIDTAGQRLQRAMQHGLDMRRMSAETLASRLLALSPLAVLQRGYAIVYAMPDKLMPVMDYPSAWHPAGWMRPLKKPTLKTRSKPWHSNLLKN